MRQSTYLLAPAAALSSLATAQTIEYITRVGAATLCLAYSDTPDVGPTPTIVPPTSPGQATTINIIAPSCNSCGCIGDHCVVTNIYQTTYEAFCPTGITTQTYVVTETYSGVSSVPTVVTTESCPFGFTSTVSTCTACGPHPVTATLTYPVTTCPYVTGIASTSVVPSGTTVSSYEFCPTPEATSVYHAAPTSPAEGGEGGGWVAVSSAAPEKVGSTAVETETDHVVSTAVVVVGGGGSATSAAGAEGVTPEATHPAAGGATTPGVSVPAQGGASTTIATASATTVKPITSLLAGFAGLFVISVAMLSA